MQSYKYKTSGTCSREITFDIDGDKIKNVAFLGGCSGNLQGISRLIDGMTPQEVITRCGGIKCGFKSTSCPDQLSKAVSEALLKDKK